MTRHASATRRTINTRPCTNNSAQDNAHFLHPNARMRWLRIWTCSPCTLLRSRSSRKCKSNLTPTVVTQNLVNIIQHGRLYPFRILMYGFCCEEFRDVQLSISNMKWWPTRTTQRPFRRHCNQCNHDPNRKAGNERHCAKKSVRQTKDNYLYPLIHGSFKIFTLWMSSLSQMFNSDWFTWQKISTNRP